jgi:hypothetical protein
MGEIVNLNRTRKRQARAAAERTAQENRARHGRTRPERERDAEKARHRAALLDGARKDDADLAGC